MESSETVIGQGLRIHGATAAHDIEQFVRGEVRRLRSAGVVLGLSGGLDSSVCAYLCVRALGSDKVLTYLLPERHSSPQNMQDAELLAQTLGLRATRLDLTTILTELGVYDLTPSEGGGARRVLARGLSSGMRLLGWRPNYADFLSTRYGTAGPDVPRHARSTFWRRSGRRRAFSGTKVRLRMVVLYHQAALHNCLVVGTTDKSEWTIGFYEPHGDGAHDISLLRHLYKTQIRELARYLGVPSQIVDKPSSADLWRGRANEDMIGLRYEQLDAVLWGLEHGLPETDIAAQAGVPREAVSDMRRATAAADARRGLPSHL